MPSNNRVSNIETKLIYLFGKEETKIDLIIGKKYAELFGELPNQNRNIIKDCKMKKKLISLFGVVRKPVKIIKKKNPKNLKHKLKIDWNIFLAWKTQKKIDWLQRKFFIYLASNKILIITYFSITLL